jgi:hypothetical protein
LKNGKVAGTELFRLGLLADVFVMSLEELHLLRDESRTAAEVESAACTERMAKKAIRDFPTKNGRLSVACNRPVRAPTDLIPPEVCIKIAVTFS